MFARRPRMQPRPTALAWMLVLCGVSACGTALQNDAEQADVEQSKPTAHPAPAIRTIIDWLDERCMVVKDASLADGTPLLIAALRPTPTVLRASVDHKLRDGERCGPLAPDRRAGNESPSTTFYIVSLPQDVDLAIGITAAPPASMANGQLDLN